jgi:hypothetical protein
MQSSSFSSTLTREEQEKLLNPHEYIGDASMGYKDCVLCRHRTEFTCIKCGYCYSCHWKKEQMEEIELRDNLKDFLLSLSKERNDDSQKLKSQKQEENKSTTQRESEKWGTLDVLGQPAEPICTYYRCHHTFSVHGSRSCKCKHPTNKTLGVFVRYY